MRNTYLLLVLFFICSCQQQGFPQPNLVLTQITSVSSPVDITGAGDNSGRLFIVDKSGKIRIYYPATNDLLAANYLDISTLVHNSGEQGLLGMAFHPNYQTNGYFYVNYVHSENGNTNTRISRFTAAPPSSNTVSAATEQILMTIPQPFSNHKGGDLAFGPDGYLYIALGDGGSGGDPGNRAQNLTERLGKMLRIDVDGNSNGNYGIPPTNPYFNSASPTNEIWALGLRNPWRFSFDRLTGDLWIADVGQGAWEELDYQGASSPGGDNYGWRCYEGNHSYNLAGCGNISAKAPVFEYPHNNAIGGFSVTGGFVYRGTDVPSLIGWYVMADYVSDNFWLVKYNGSSWVNNLQTNVPVVDISTFGEDDEGELYAASLGGPIYKVSATPLPLELLAFNGSYQEGRVRLNWATTTEKETAYFQIERKTEGRDFEPIGKVAAKGSSTVQQNYFFEDVSAQAGANNYRLKMVDLDQTFRYSSVISILVKQPAGWQISPNPTSGEVLVQLTDQREIASLQFEVFNTQGDPVYSHSESSPEFPFQKTFNLRHLPAGVYFCRLQMGKETAFQRLIVE